jgi:thiosulfate dehydrogenase [quinone] large subunit
MNMIYIVKIITYLDDKKRYIEIKKSVDSISKELRVMFAWLRNNVFAAGMLLVLRVYLGWQWVTAGFHKITADTPFDASGFLKAAVANPVTDKATGLAVYPTYAWFLEHIALPQVKWINVLIPWGEFLVGLGLILGALTTAAAFFGIMMNFLFLFAGTVSTNPWMLLIGAFIFIAGANAGKFGADYYLLPYLKHWIRRNRTGGGVSNAGGHAGTNAGDGRYPAHA